MTRDRKSLSTERQPRFAGAANRRELLKRLSLAGLAAGSTSLPVVAAQAAPIAAPADSTQTPFNETDHVRKFYDLARR
jgi:hypothetical protein